MAKEGYWWEMEWMADWRKVKIEAYIGGVHGLVGNGGLSDEMWRDSFSSKGGGWNRGVTGRRWNLSIKRWWWSLGIKGWWWSLGRIEVLVSRDDDRVYVARWSLGWWQSLGSNEVLVYRSHEVKELRQFGGMRWGFLDIDSCMWRKAWEGWLTMELWDDNDAEGRQLQWWRMSCIALVVSSRVNP